MIIFRCKNCRTRFTNVLKELTKIPDYYSIQDEDYFEKGHFHKLIKNNSVYYLLNVSDSIDLINHPDTGRFSGCCGPSPDGPCNQICGTCKTEVGRETTECIFPHYLQIKEKSVLVESDDLGFYKILSHPISAQLKAGKLMEIESIYQYSNRREALHMLSKEIANLAVDLPPEIVGLIKI